MDGKINIQPKHVATLIPHEQSRLGITDTYWPILAARDHAGRGGGYSIWTAGHVVLFE